MSESKETTQTKRTSKRKRTAINYKETKTYRAKSLKRKSKRQKIDSGGLSLESKLNEESPEPFCIQLLEGARSVSTEFGGIPIDLRGILEPPPMGLHNINPTTF